MTLTLTAAAPSFPVEVWLQILRWATLHPSTHALYTSEYSPFKAVDVNIGTPETLCTKLALVLVCKDWRRWTLPLLYEDIQVSSSQTLNRLLQSGEALGDNLDATSRRPADFVRRAHLPYSSTATSTPHSPRSLATLALCSSLDVLVRTADAFSPCAYEFSIECPPLPSLKRIDWWHHNEAARTGGINSLMHVLGAAPNVEYLSVGGELWPTYLHTAPIELPHLTTLRFRRVNALFVVTLCRWTIPSLRHVIFDNVADVELFWAFWTTFGSQVRTVELGISLKFYIQDFLEYVFAGCTQLEELNYYVHFTHAPRTDRPQNTLKTVGLHAHPNSFFCVGSAEYWEHVGRHFEAFASAAFPAVKRVLLYGDWAAAMETQEFDRIAQPLRDKGCMITVA
ncbi:hypothetical protein L226DRAFT_455172 [Lentinus tigrinus ALCF2SS1-7]|uniref:F-box domain-containing protein n=1 Tax=Lentinus tigrinus ALCF2SS1-6 TaxID=1328759 RepID=A0A5C2SST6_9APHY|nr:hypothetical protein L227DRAFT_143372 [Lentinus tigrinus ALCF2SS1-6]RPD80321.1 hypothetical protein L226DRAFT_455172 [Lentinus tigrinus ALCF2SS1-7]